MALLAAAKIMTPARNERMQRIKRKTRICAWKSSMRYWPDHLPCGNQKHCHFLVAVWRAKEAQSAGWLHNEARCCRNCMDAARRQHKRVIGVIFRGQSVA